MKYLIITAMIIASCGSNNSSLTDEELDRMADEILENEYGVKPKGQSVEELKSLSEFCAQEQVKNYLKSPTTAEFNTSAKIDRYNDSTFIVAGTVDSQNGFGAMIRSKYSCVISFTDGGENYVMTLMDIK